MRIVKKTLKGDLLGKTGFKKVGGRARPSENGAAEPGIPGTPSLPNDDGFVIVSDPLRPRGPAPASAAPSAVPAAVTPPREVSPEERQAMSEAEADLAATSLGVTQSPGGRRGNVAQVRDGGAPVTIAAPPPPPVVAPPASPQPIVRTAPPPAGTRLEGESVARARMVLAEALFRDCGAPGTKMQHPRGGSFQVQARFGDGIVRTQHDLLLPLPAGHVTPHTADLVIELEPRGILVLDIVASHVPLADLKARAFDALQLRRIDRCFSVLLFVRCPGAGMAQGQAEAIAHGYDALFGIDEEHTHSEAKFQAVRSRTLQWLEAASAANRGSR